MRRTLVSRIFAAGLTFVTIDGGASLADVIYTFDGTPYNSFEIDRPDLVTDVFSARNHVSVELKFSTPLAANLTYDAAAIQPRLTPIDWLISDGNVTMTSSNAVLGYIELGTNSLGQIDAWAIAADFYTDIVPTYNIGVYSGCQPRTHCLPPDETRDYSAEWANVDGEQVFIEGNGTLANTPDGQWAATTPEPSTWAMMLIGIAGLGYTGWRSRKTAALAP
jgi:hypothetical protein